MEKITFSRTEITEDKLMLMARTSELVKQLNSLTLADFAKKQEIVKDLFGSVGSNPFVGDNFHCDFGKNIHVGDNFHADYNCTMLDVAEIRIGHNCLIGPDVGIYTAGHRLEPEGRTLDGYGLPITIGNDVWIGGHSTVLPGVTIGDGAVIRVRWSLKMLSLVPCWLGIPQRLRNIYEFHQVHSRREPLQRSPFIGSKSQTDGVDRNGRHQGSVR